ncbi:hypothetical protein L6452_13784 [Arctium lappa]|uniref:Uncharacterized protein n=1 Tax=Arctium lappa TaxID=4217 RepID=A0ACB9CJ24_ARCLA|nr:hypothetical protein L6452_13784 [Arctium lappa]
MLILEGRSNSGGKIKGKGGDCNDSEDGKLMLGVQDEFGWKRLPEWSFQGLARRDSVLFMEEESTRGIEEVAWAEILAEDARMESDVRIDGAVIYGKVEIDENEIRSDKIKGIIDSNKENLSQNLQYIDDSEKFVK